MSYAPVHADGCDQAVQKQAYADKSFTFGATEHLCFLSKLLMCAGYGEWLIVPSRQNCMLLHMVGAMQIDDLLLRLAEVSDLQQKRLLPLAGWWFASHSQTICIGLMHSALASVLIVHADDTVSRFGCHSKSVNTTQASAVTGIGSSSS